MVQSWIMQGPLSVRKTHSAHRVFPSPSEIPYGGFSPVRLQTGTIRRHLHRLRRLIGGLKHRSPPNLGLPRGEGRERRCVPVQRPLARRRVMLSRRVVAYYGLIRASGTTPGGLFVSPAGLCLAAAGQKVPAFSLRILPFVPPSVPRQTGRPKDDSTSARDSLRPNARGSASATSHLNRYTWVP